MEYQATASTTLLLDEEEKAFRLYLDTDPQGPCQNDMEPYGCTRGVTLVMGRDVTDTVDLTVTFMRHIITVNGIENAGVGARPIL